MTARPVESTTGPVAAQAAIQTIRFDHPIAYQDAYAMQADHRDAVAAGTAPNALFLLEHTPVFTLGRNARESHLLQSREQLHLHGIDVVDVDRGGDVTYHGPGQLVAYPVLRLSQWKESIHWYLRELESVIIDVLASYGIVGDRLDGYTGVWVGGAKVAAIGVAIHQWVSYHGIALNVDPNMDHWRLIVPCGIPDKPVTSLRRLLGTPPAMSEVMSRYGEVFLERFERNQF